MSSTRDRKTKGGRYSRTNHYTSVLITTTMVERLEDFVTFRSPRNYVIRSMRYVNDPKTHKRCEELSSSHVNLSYSLLPHSL